MQEEVQNLPTTNEAKDASDEDTPSGDGDLPEGWEEAAAENVGCDDSTAPRGRAPKARRIDADAKGSDEGKRFDANGKDLWRPRPGHHSAALRSDGSRVGPSRDLSRKGVEG